MARCAAIAKNELFYSGPFGLVAWLCGTIFIERSDPKSSHASMNKAGDIVKNKKVTTLANSISPLTTQSN